MDHGSWIIDRWLIERGAPLAGMAPRVLRLLLHRRHLMRYPVALLALSSLSLAALPARAETPILVDREALAKKLHWMDEQLGGLSQQAAQQAAQLQGGPRGPAASQLQANL